MEEKNINEGSELRGKTKSWTFIYTEAISVSSAMMNSTAIGKKERTKNRILEKVYIYIICQSLRDCVCTHRHTHVYVCVYDLIFNGGLNKNLVFPLLRFNSILNSDYQ